MDRCHRRFHDYNPIPSNRNTVILMTAPIHPPYSTTSHHCTLAFLEDTLGFILKDWSRALSAWITYFILFSSFISSKQASVQYRRTWRLYPERWLFIFFESCPSFFWDWDVLFSLFWIGLGFFGNGIGDEDEDGMDVRRLVAFGWLGLIQVLRREKRVEE